jgi:hypothetical protein
MKIKRKNSFDLRIGLLLACFSAFLPNLLAQSDSTNFWKNIPKGPQVHGYFEGRSPCREITEMLNADGRDSCIKIKWQLLLFQDPVTHAPTTYALGGFAWRNPPKTGKWAIIKGTKEDPNAVVYQLEPDNPQGFLSFVKADDNILLFLDKEKKLLVGNSQFSYTLNRVR